MLKGEEEIIKFWDEKKIYQKVKENRKDAEPFFFLDGPPYATGRIHVGTAFNQVMKDSYRRFFRMRGFNVWDQPGFDTHGLPIENKVEKKFGFKSKKDIEDFGVEKFLKECRSFATEHIGVMTDQFKNLGVWADWENPYLTLDNEYMEGAWYTFKKGFEKGLLYKGTYPVHVCPHCATAVAYNEIEHKKTSDPSLYLKFKVSGKENEYFIIWTTTPWTLPANVAIMANPNADYAKVKVGEDVFVLLDNRIVEVMKTAGVEKYEVLEKFKGKDLKNVKYDYPLKGFFKYQDQTTNAHKVILSDQYVTTEDGSGFVHTAPGHGQEDFKVGLENKLPAFSPVNMNGTFNNDVGQFSGMFVKKANPLIIEELDARGLVLNQGKIDHEYPFCWRCSSALILISVPQWFFKITEIRDRLLQENEKIKWNPKWAGERFNNWLENLSDWPISRQRYWGIPLPIWECTKCDEIKVIGSVKELGTKLDDYHKPHIDNVTLKCEKCSSEMKRVPDVMDVWFDSGVASWASLGYPGNEKLYKNMWPSNIVMEGPDQIRGWWNSSLIAGVITFDKSPMRNVLFHGFGLDSHGVKMSKSKGNTVEPEEVANKHSRDVMRYYYLSRIPWDDFYFKWDDVKDIGKSFYVIRNVFNFVHTYVKDSGKPDNLKVEDKWILSKLNTLTRTVTENMETYNGYKAARSIVDFILNDFSRWYIKIIRDRVWVGYEGEDRDAAFYTMYTVSKQLTILLTPFTPFMSEEFYQNIVNGLKKSKESVHLEDWPKFDTTKVDDKIEKQMEIAKQIFETSQAARQEAEIKLRWPVRQIVILGKDDETKEAVENMQEILTNMCNTKVIGVVDSKPEGNFVGNDFDYGTLFLDKEMDEYTLGEAMFRETLRFVQNLRKVNKFNVNDSVNLYINSDDETNKKLEKYKDKMYKEVGANEIAIGKSSGEFNGKLKFKDVTIEIGFDKA